MNDQKIGCKQIFLCVDICLAYTEAAVCRGFNKIAVLENFTKFTGQHLCQGFLLIKLKARCFSNVAKFLRTPFS